MLIWGRHGIGRTTLLQAICHYYFAQGIAVALLNCGRGHHLLADQLAAAGPARLICLDNLQRAEADLPMQEVLMDYWQGRALQSQPAALLMASTAPADSLQLLPDLVSRLEAGTQYRLIPLGEQARTAAVLRKAREQDSLLPPAVADYIVRQSSQDLASCLRSLQQVLEISRARRKPVTVQLAREVF